MKKLCILFLSLLVSPTFATGISGANAPCDNATLNKYTGTANVEINWEPNTINLNWYDGDTKLTVANNSQTCVYDGTLTVPAQPTKPGYTFNGWKVIRVPGGFTELEYIKSTGTQWIDTGIVGNLNTKIDIDFSIDHEQPTGNTIVFGNRTDNNVRAFYLATKMDSLLYAQFDSIERQKLVEPEYNVNQKYSSTVSKDGWYLNGVLCATYNGATTFITNGNILLFKLGGQDALSKGGVSIYKSILYENNVIIQKLIPARRNSDGVVGMYDSITNQFFTNAGTGAFIAGPAVQ